MSDGSVMQLFLDAAKNKKVLGAYLLTCGRMDVALRIADTFLLNLFCKNGGCGRCSDCRKVIQGHIDILKLSAPKVNELRGALSFVSEKPYEGAYKAVVITNADDMTPQAANSLLKTLEEPPPDTVFVLIARAVCSVLPTIASRCAVITLSPIPNAQKVIAETLGCDAQTAALLADLSGGFPNEAKRIFEDKEFLTRREETLLLLHKLIMQKGMAISTFVDYLEKYKDNFREVLGIMLSYLRDIRVFKKTRDEVLIVNRDRLEDINLAADIFTSGTIRNMINIIFETGKRFFVAVNFRLAVEKMLFCILEEKNQCSK